MILAIMFGLGVLTGWLIPRDAFPWMRRLSAFFMRNRRNDLLAFGTFLFAVAVMALALLLSGCGPKIPTSQVKPSVAAWLPAQGKSMLPTFPERSLIEVEFGVPFDELKAGDTVIFWDYTRGAKALTHHRLVAKQAGAWIAQGDNPETNPVADRPWVTADNFIARGTGRHTQLLISTAVP